MFCHHFKKVVLNLKDESSKVPEPLFKGIASIRFQSQKLQFYNHLQISS